MSGLDLLRRIRESDPGIPVIMLTAYGSIEGAVEAVKLGAFDYILKPYNLEQVESSVVACIAHREYLKQSWWKRMALRPAS